MLKLIFKNNFYNFLEINILDNFKPRSKSYNGIILGADISLRNTGLVLIDFKIGLPVKLIYIGTIAHSRKVNFFNCIASIHRSVELILSNYRNIHVVLESTIYVQNISINQKLGAARGAVISAAKIYNSMIFEYDPTFIKKSISGCGRSNKIKISKIINEIISPNESLIHDEIDAFGVAFCHSMSYL